MAQKYKIIEVKEGDGVLYTKVQYDLDGKTIEVDIPHFHPKTIDDVKLGIENRASSEQTKLDAVEKCKELIEEIEINKEVEIVKK